MKFREISGENFGKIPGNFSGEKFPGEIFPEIPGNLGRFWSIFGKIDPLSGSAFLTTQFCRADFKKKIFYFSGLARCGVFPKCTNLSPKKSGFFEFQHKIEDFRFFEGASAGYYIDSSPSFILYIKVLQTDSPTRFRRHFKCWVLN
jgi:hypothetical protein